MSNKTRKRFSPMLLVMSLAVVGVLAAFIALAAQPGTSEAHGPGDHASLPALRGGMIRPAAGESMTTLTRLLGEDGCPGTGNGTGNGNGNGNGMMTTGAMIESSSTSASVAVQLKLTILDLPMDLEGGSSVVLYLEDDFKVPDNIDRDTVYFTAKGGSGDDDESTSNGRRVYATDPVEIDTDAHFTADKKDWDIQVLIPDMNTSDVDKYSNFDGPKDGQTLTLTFTKSSGIKNNSEAGKHSVGYSILGPTDAVGGPQVKDADIANAPLATVAKISLSDVDNDRGYELTVTGTGFNNDTSATVHVLGDATPYRGWWKSTWTAPR